MAEKLKPCPFCGSKAKFVTKTSNVQGVERGFSFRIECSKCGVHINRKLYELKLTLNDNGEIETVIDERQLAVDEWNKRSIEYGN